MNFIYLSPSTQEFNEYVNGGTEEYYMNLIADRMIPYMMASNIGFTRNIPTMNATKSTLQSNLGDYGLHLALHSNASPESLAGTLRGVQIYYYPESVNGKIAADIFANNIKAIYPIPSLVKTIPTTTLFEVARSKAPAILIETAYHDNLEDATWIKNNIERIAENYVISLTEFFGIPFILPECIKYW